MTDINLQLLGLSLSILFSAFIVYRLSKIYINNDKLNDLINVHFKKDDIKVISIDKLSFRERIKYGVPPLDIFRFYNYYFAILSGKLDFNRKAKIKDTDGQLGTSYLSITVKNKQTYQIKEYDFYMI